MRRTLLILSVLLVICTATSFAVSSIPQKINYQGVLLDSNQDPVTQATQVIYRIYDTQGKAILWEETHTVTPDSAGQFSAILGSLESLSEEILTGEQRWLGITVGTDSELSPRTELVSSAYAFRVATIDNAKGGEIQGTISMVESADGILPVFIMSGTLGDTLMFCPASSCESLIRATNQAGDEVFNLSVEASNQAALLVIKGPGGDDVETMMSNSSLEIGNNIDRAFNRVVVLDVDEGMVLLSRTNPSDTLVQIHEAVGGLASILVKDPLTGASTIFSTGEQAVQVFDANDNVQVTIGLDPDGGGSVNVWDGTNRDTRMSSKLLSLTKQGLKIFDATGVTEIAQLTKDGDCFAQGKIAVGEGSTATGEWSTVFGFGNTASGDSATVSGGYWNTASGHVATVSGGANNIAAGVLSVVGGGNNNLADNEGAFVGGGYDNQATGILACVVSGWHARAVGNYSFATGFGAKANHDGSMVLSATSSPIESDSVMTNGIGQMVLRAQGGLFITNGNGLATARDDAKLIQTVTGAFLASDGFWVDAPPKFRGQVIPSENRDILDKLRQLSIEEYGSLEEGNARHIGPVPEEFNALFGLGRDDGSIAASDVAGVALAAVKELQRKTEEIAQLKLRLQENEIMLTQLSALIQQVLAQQETDNDNPKEMAINR